MLLEVCDSMLHITANYEYPRLGFCNPTTPNTSNNNLHCYTLANFGIFRDVIFTNQRHTKVTGHSAYKRWINNDDQSCH
jgi:hypothetical protein